MIRRKKKWEWIGDKYEEDERNLTWNWIIVWMLFFGITIFLPLLILSIKYTAMFLGIL